MYTAANDTLVFDSQSLSAWRANPAYAYDQGAGGSEYSLWDMLSQWLRDWLIRYLGRDEARWISDCILWGLAVALLLFIAWWIYKKRPGLFKRGGRGRQHSEEEEDTIYGVDFETEINQAAEQADYRRAIRFVYLFALKQLSDDQLVDWQLSKTPTEYVHELKDAGRLPAFRELTQLFLRIRYGNVEATPGLYERASALRQALRKGEPMA